MTEETDGQARTEEDNQALDQIRKVLAEGFAFVRGAEVREGIATLSLEEMLARAIQDIEEDETDIRPGRLTAIRNLRQQVTDTIARVREMPAEMFVLADAENAAITRQDGTGPTEDDDG